MDEKLNTKLEFVADTELTCLENEEFEEKNYKGEP